MALHRSAIALSAFVTCGALLTASMTATAAVPLAHDPGGTAPLTPAWSKTAADEVPTVTFTAVLPYDRQKLRKVARKISTPQAARFRQFLTLEEAAAAVGASSQARQALRQTARDLGIRVDIDGTGLTARLTAPLETWVDIYGREFVATEAAPRSASVYIPNADNTSYEPDVPAALDGVVAKVFPIDTQLISPEKSPTMMDQPVNEGTPFGPGTECLAESQLADTYSPNQLHVPYGTTALHDSKITGKNASLAIIGLGQSYNPGLVEVAGECFDYRVPEVSFVGAPGIGNVPVPLAGSGSIESNLDVQTSAAVLPDAQSIAFIETSASVSFLQNILQGYTTALTEVRPAVTTLSYGECISVWRESGDWAGRGYLDDLFAFAAIVGTSVLVAAGDNGSSNCLHGGGTNAQREVAYPAASPWATAVGGTRIILGEGNVRVNEVVWNSTTWAPGLQAGGAGGPAPTKAPWYQRSVTSSDRRLVPDVAAHAAISPGWPVVMTPEQYASGPWPALPIGATWGMAPIGGTSASSPFTAANLALIASKKGRLGFVNPWLYSLAQDEYDVAFFDVVDGNNMVDPEAACCAAYKGYDMATGLGAPNFDTLLDLVDQGQ